MTTKEDELRWCVTLEAQEGETYADILACAQHVSSLGFDGLYRSDHYASVWGAGAGSTDAWATLAGLARETSLPSLGTMVTPTTFRPASNLAMVVATVAQMAGTFDSHPRVHLGLGTGWLESEHTMFGFPYDDTSTRFRRLEEQAQVITGLWASAGEPYSYEGEFEQLREAVFLPSPTPRPRIVLGGSGRRKTVRMATLYADELNTPFPTPDDVRELRSALDRASEMHGRDRIPLTVTTACIVGDDEQQYRQRLEQVHGRVGGDSPLADWERGRQATWAIGTTEQVTERLAALIDAGAEGFSLQHLVPKDLEMLDLLMAGVIRNFR